MSDASRSSRNDAYGPQGREEHEHPGGESPDQPSQQIPQPDSLTADARSRRTFLKGAVAASASAAAATGAAGALFAFKSHAPVVLFASGRLSGGQASCMCASGVPASATDALEAVATPGNPIFPINDPFYLWVPFANVPAGGYTFNITPTVQSAGNGNCTGNPLSYQGASGNVVQYYSYSSAFPCLPSNLSSIASEAGSGSDTLPMFSALDIGTSTINLLYRVALQSQCAGAFTVIASLTGGPMPFTCSTTLTFGS